jgi:hypothetical protein
VSTDMFVTKDTAVPSVTAKALRGAIQLLDVDAVDLSLITR